MFKIIPKNQQYTHNSDHSDLYQYTAYIGHHKIKTSDKSSYWYIDNSQVHCSVGNNKYLKSDVLCVEIIGYTPETRSSSFNRGTDLPYINGCSTKQLITAARSGDPTFQYLYIPKFTSEQEHHIHSTDRIVYVYSGQGISKVGTSGNFQTHQLNQGDTIILKKMIPHHFETTDSELIVLPLHIFSSTGSTEFNHPMYNGTHRI
jgi:hypothetical protein